MFRHVQLIRSFKSFFSFITFSNIGSLFIIPIEYSLFFVGFDVVLYPSSSLYNSYTNITFLNPSEIAAKLFKSSFKNCFSEYSKK
jgi:hypothetical protein